MATDRPLTHEELRKRRPVKAVGQAPARSVRHSFYVASAGRDAPEISTTIEEVASTGGRRVYRVDIGPAISGELVAHPPTLSRKTHSWKHFSKASDITRTQPHRPEFIAMNHFPARRRRPEVGTRPRLVLNGNPVRPLEVFQPDRRQQLFDQSYPWRTVGQTFSPVGDGTARVGTGALVGPRHVLTASHCVSWNAPGGASLQFTPAFTGGSPPPFGQSWGIWAYDYRQIDEPQDQLDVSEDYVVVVLDQRLGDNLG